MSATLWSSSSRAGRHGINKIERDLVRSLAPWTAPGTLTAAGVDRLAMCPDWGEVPQPVLPADVVAAANAGEPWRKPARGEASKLHAAWRALCNEERMAE